MIAGDLYRVFEDSALFELHDVSGREAWLRVYFDPDGVRVSEFAVIEIEADPARRGRCNPWCDIPTVRRKYGDDKWRHVTEAQRPLSIVEVGCVRDVIAESLAEYASNSDADGRI